jgi:hypothetical protein
MRSPVQFLIYNRGRRFEHTVSAPDSFELRTRVNDLESGTFEFPDSHPAFDAATAPGARVLCRYRGETILSGRLRAQTFRARSGSSTYAIRGDSYALDKARAWVSPARPLTQLEQGQEAQEGAGGYYRVPGAISSAEGAVKQIIRDNLVLRLGRPYDIAPDLDRGGNARAAGVLDALTIRFETLRDAVAPILAWSGLSLEFIQQPGSDVITVDVREPRTWTQKLTAEAGILQEADAEIEDPELTRLLLLGNGEGPERMIYALNDETGREATYGEVLEDAIDATSGELEWPEEVPEEERIPAKFFADSRVSQDSKDRLKRYFRGVADEKLREGGARSSISAKLSETTDFHLYGKDGRHPGDFLNLAINAREPILDRISGADLTLDADGFRVEPVLGDEVDDEDERVWAAINDLRRTRRG